MINSKVWVGVGIVAVLAVAFIALRSPATAPVVPYSAQNPGTSAGGVVVNSPAPAGTPAAEVDVTVDAILANADDEATLTQAEEANADIVADSSALADLGTAFNSDDL